MFAPHGQGKDDPDDEVVLADYYAWTGLIRILFTILLRIGYILIQIGCVPVNNVNLILLHNAVDICWVTLIYLAIGSLISHNAHAKAFIEGKGHYIGHIEVDRDEEIMEWSAIVVGSAICTSLIVGRTHTVGYIVIGFLLSAVIQPLLMHWIWSPNGWLKTNALSSESGGVNDYAGAISVHLVGGLSGLIGCMILGRRILRLRDIDESSISSSSAATVFAGHLLVFIGLTSISLPNSETAKIGSLVAGVSHVYLNTLLAAGACCLCVVILHFVPSKEAFNHWTVTRCVQAMVAGVVMVSGGSNKYRHWVSIVLGCIGGVIQFLMSKIIFHSALEDNCNIVATHFVCAVFASLLVPLCTIRQDAGTASVAYEMSWQFLCLLLASVLILVIMTIAFICLEFFGILRNRSEHLNHARATVALRRAPPKRICFRRIFAPDSNSVYLQPGSLTKSGQRPSPGSRFWAYQSEIQSIEKINEESRAGLRG